MDIGDFVTQLTRFRFLETLCVNMLPSRHQKLDIDVILSNLIALKSLQLVNCTLEKKSKRRNHMDSPSWTLETGL